MSEEEKTNDTQSTAGETMTEESAQTTSKTADGEVKESGKSFFETLTEKFRGLGRNGQIACGVGAVLVLLIVIIAVAASGGSRYEIADYGENFYMKFSNTLLYNAEGGVVESEERIYGIYTSADASLTAFLDQEETLFVAGKKGAVKVDDDVAAGSIVLSFYGDTIAYVKDASGTVGDLYLYNVAKGKSVKIDQDVYTSNIVLSPDGKSLAYLGDCETSVWSVEGNLYVSRKGKSGEKICSDGFALALTDGGKKVYYIKGDGKLYVNDDKIASDVDSDVYAFNADNTEMIYNKDGNSYYYTLKSKEPLKLKGERFTYLILPNQAAAQTQQCGTYKYICTYGVDTLDQNLIVIGGSIYYLSDKGRDVEKVINAAQGYQVSEDGKSILYLNDGELFYMKNVAKSDQKECVGEDIEAWSFTASADLKKIYYISDGDLYYLSKGKGVRVADDVDGYVYSEKFGLAYFISDEELFSVKDKSKTKTKVMGEEVTRLYLAGDTVLFNYYDDDGDVAIYAVTGKKKVKELIHEE